MNDRIKELASQAYGLCKKINDEGQEVVLTDEWNQKFAELIVRECADTIKSNQWAKDNQAWSKGMNYSAELIKEHFGVEE